MGQAVFPNFGQGSFTPTDLGEGAETTAAVLGPQAALYGNHSGFQVVLLAFSPAAPAGVRRSPGSGAPWPGSARASSSQLAWYSGSGPTA